MGGGNDSNVMRSGGSSHEADHQGQHPHQSQQPRVQTGHDKESLPVPQYQSGGGNQDPALQQQYFQLQQQQLQLQQLKHLHVQLQYQIEQQQHTIQHQQQQLQHQHEQLHHPQFQHIQQPQQYQHIQQHHQTSVTNPPQPLAFQRWAVHSSGDGTPTHHEDRRADGPIGPTEDGTQRAGAVGNGNGNGNSNGNGNGNPNGSPDSSEGRVPDSPRSQNQSEDASVPTEDGRQRGQAGSRAESFSRAPVESSEKKSKRKEPSKERKDYRKTVEKKRRAKITNAIDEFREIIPTTGVDKIKKALVLELAVEYIKQLKTDYERLLEKNQSLVQRNAALRAEKQSLDQSKPATPSLPSLSSPSSTSTTSETTRPPDPVP